MYVNDLHILVMTSYLKGLATAYPCMIRFIQRQGAKIDFREVYGAKSDALIDISN
jgi:hypothetical protein